MQFGFDTAELSRGVSTDNAGILFVPVVAGDITAASNHFISTGSTPVTYDAAGNITQDMKFRVSGSLGMKYEYDANGRQATAKLSDDTTLETSVYDCAGQRVQTTAGNLTRTMVYDIFRQDVADYSSVGDGLERENIYRAGQLLATQEFPVRTNFALAANGATATAQNYTQDGVYPGLHFQPSYANDGTRYTTPSGDHYWRDEHGLSSWLEIDFSGSKTIDEVDVFTIRDDYQAQADPSPTQTFANYGSRRSTCSTGTAAPG